MWHSFSTSAPNFCWVTVTKRHDEANESDNEIGSTFGRASVRDDNGAQVYYLIPSTQQHSMTLQELI